MGIVHLYITHADVIAAEYAADAVGSCRAVSPGGAPAHHDMHIRNWVPIDGRAHENLGFHHTWELLDCFLWATVDRCSAVKSGPSRVFEAAAFGRVAGGWDAGVHDSEKK